MPASSIAKYGKIAALVAGLGAGGAAGYGYKGGDRGVKTQELTVYARPDKVWDLVSDPQNMVRWVPKEFLDIEKVDTLGPKGTGKIASFFGASDDELTPGEPTHVLHLRDGTTLKLVVTMEEDEMGRRETVVVKDGQIDKQVTAAEWGFEVPKGDKLKRETSLKFTRRMTLARPYGVLREVWYRISGKRESTNMQIFEGIERAARD
jgi:hypothetical protein